MVQFLILGLAFVGQLAFADSQSYWIQYYPRVEKTCEQQATVFGKRFEALTKITDYQVECNGETKEHYFLRIKYEAPEPLNVVSTVSEDNTSTLPQGTYSTINACASALKEEVAHFQTATGLTPMVAYCYSGLWTGSSHSIAMKIDGFGKAKLRPFLVERSFYTAGPTAGYAQLEAQLKSKLSAAGYDVRQAFFRRDVTGFLSIAVRYYAESSMPLIYWDKFSYSSIDQCRAQLAQISEALAAYQADSLALSCPTASSGDVFWLQLYSSAFELFQHDFGYSSFNACVADRARVTKEYNDKEGWDVRGAVCEGRGSRFSMHLFKTPAVDDFLAAMGI